MRYLRDTNIFSNLTKAAGSESLIAWMAEQSDEDLLIARRLLLKFTAANPLTAIQHSAILPS